MGCRGDSFAAACGPRRSGQSARHGHVVPSDVRGPLIPTADFRLGFTPSERWENGGSTAVAWLQADEPGGNDRVRAGRVCVSALPPGMELSCGTYGFGDLRRVCQREATGGRCARSSAVTVRNTGHTLVHVTVISGPGQGIREQGTDQVLAPGQSATLRPGPARILFDITLRHTGTAHGRLEVTDVR